MDTISISATVGGNGFDTKIAVHAGEQLTITTPSDGTWNYGTGLTCGPTGIGSFYSAQFQDNSVSQMSLIGRIGTSGSWFYIGAGLVLEATTSGPLYLGMNDSISPNGFFDNSGELMVTVAIGSTQDGSCDCITYAAGDCKTSGNPISLLRGEKREEVTDIGVNTPAGMMTFTRAYRQSKLFDANYKFMGLGWTHNHGMQLTPISGSPGRIVVRTTRGGEAHFTSVTGSPNDYSGDPGSTASIHDDGTNYTLTSSDKTHYIFNSSGQLTFLVYPSGETWAYGYDLMSHKLISVTDSYGAGLHLSYISDPGQFDDGQLWRVGDLAATGLSSSSPAGRYVEYGYIVEKLNGTSTGTNNPLLATIRDVRGNLWTYNYYGQAVGETDSNQQDFLTEWITPEVDTTGNGATNHSLSRDKLTYTMNGTLVAGIHQVRGDSAVVTDWAFQPLGQNITTETTANKTSTHFFNNSLDIGTQDPAGHMSSRALDSQYRPVAQVDANGHQTNLTWSSDAKFLNQVVDALGNQTSFTYNTNIVTINGTTTTSDTLNSSLDAQGRQTQYVYGDINNPRLPTEVRVLDTDGVTVLRWQRFTYDTKGRTLTEQTLDPVIGQPQQQVKRSYYSEGNGNGLLHTLVQNDLLNAANDVTTTYFYDNAGRVIRTNQTATFGSCTSSFTLYDAAGNTLASVCNYAPGNQPDPTALSSLLALYNPAAPEMNRITAYSYDALNRRVQTITNAGSPNAVTSVTVYDALDRVVRTISNYVPSGSIPYPYIQNRNAFPHGPNNDQNVVTDTIYNERGLVRSQTDVLGNVTLFGYDDADRLVKMVQSASQPAYDNSYDANGDYSLSNYAVSGQLDQDIITTSAYDPAGNLTRSTDVLGNVTLTGYDALNRPVKTVRNASQPSYDLIADPTLMAYPISSAADKDILDLTDYDSMGRVVRSQDTLGRWTLFGYDSLGRQIKTIQNASQPSYDLTDDPALSHYVVSQAQDQDAVSQTAYDNLGRVLYTTDALGHRTWSVYDGLGRVVKTIVNAVGTATDGGFNDPRSARYVPSTDPDKDVISQMTYDTNGYVLWTQDALGNRTWLAYDNVGRQIKTIVNAMGTATDGGPNDPRSANYVPSPAADNDLIMQTAYDALGRVLWTQDTLGNRTWLAYDALGRRSRTIANAVGTAIDGGPNDPRSLSYVPSPATDKDLVSQAAFDVAGRTLWTQDALGRRTWFAYDAAGRQVKTIVNAVGTLADGSIHDPRAINYAVSGDADKDLITQTSYDRASRTTWTQDPLSHRAWVGYDAVGRQVKAIANATGTATDGGVSDPRSVSYIISANPDQDVISQTVYNKAGQVISTIDALGNQTQYTYDGLGRRVKTLQNVLLGTPSPNRPDQDLLSTSTYNQAGQLLTTTDARGTQTTFTYDGLGRRLTVTQAASTSLAVTSYTCYDKAGRVLRTIQNWISDPTQPSPDARDARSNFLFKPWNHGGANDQNLISTYTLDALGRQIASSDSLGDTSSLTYSKDGQVASMTDPLGVVTKYRYDLARRRTLAVTSWHHQTYLAVSLADPATWYWDTTAGRWTDGTGTVIHDFLPAEPTDQNVIVQTIYDKAGRMTALRDPRGNQTTYSYDQLNRRTSLTDPLAHVWSTQYINANNLLQTTVIDPMLNATQQTADGLGRLKTIQYPNDSDDTTPDVAFQYDKGGNRLAMTETSSTGTVRSTAYSYDQARRLRQVDFDTDGNGTIDQSVSYGYDAGGLRTRLTLPGNLSVIYSYDTRSQLTSLTDWASQPTAYSYDRVGRLATISRSNGLLSQYGYDAAGRLQRLRHSTGTRLLGQFDYRVDARGNRTQATETVAQNTPATTLAYNNAAVVYYSGSWTASVPLIVSADVSAALRIPFSTDQFTLTMGVGPDHATYDVYIDGDLWQTVDGYAASAGTQTYSVSLNSYGSHLLDIRNRPEHNLQSTGFKIRFQSLALSGQAYDWQTLKYSYDALSRLTNANSYAGTNTGSSPIRQYSYGYDLAGNRLQQVVTDDGSTTSTDYTYDLSNRLMSDGSHTFAYDNAGRMTSDGVNTYVWDRANRLLSMGSSAYQYDGMGRRVQQTVATQVTQYLLDTQPGLWKVIGAIQDTNTTRYVHAVGGGTEQQSSGTWVWKTLDGLGSVRSVVDNGANLLESQLYDPYGQPYGITGSSQTIFGFAGEPTDANGLVQLRARHYNPTLGQFLSLDPIENPNRYQYVGGNPINARDPSGLCINNDEEETDCAAAGSVGVLLADDPNQAMDAELIVPGWVDQPSQDVVIQSIPATEAEIPEGFTKVAQIVAKTTTGKLQGFLVAYNSPATLLSYAMKLDDGQIINDTVPNIEPFLIRQGNAPSTPMTSPNLISEFGISIGPSSITVLSPSGTTNPTQVNAPVCTATLGLTPTITSTPDCSAVLSGGRYPVVPIIKESQLTYCRPQAAITIANIRSNGPFPTYGSKNRVRDNIDWFNVPDPAYGNTIPLPPPSDRTRRIPTGYLEYTVPTGMSPRGDWRIVTFGVLPRVSSGFRIMYYTNDHYQHFSAIQQGV